MIPLLENFLHLRSRISQAGQEWNPRRDIGPGSGRHGRPLRWVINPYPRRDRILSERTDRWQSRCVRIEAHNKTILKESEWDSIQSINDSSWQAITGASTAAQRRCRHNLSKQQSRAVFSAAGRPFPLRPISIGRLVFKFRKLARSDHAVGRWLGST